MTMRRAALATVCAVCASCTASSRVAAPQPNPSRLPVVSPALQGSAGGVLPPSRSIVALIPVGDVPEGVAIGAGSVWVANHGSGSVSRIDPGTNRTVARIRVGEGPARIVVGAGAVWVTDDKDRLLWRIDPRTNHARALQLQGRVSGTPTMALGALWATVWDDSTLVRIDPRTNRTRIVAHLDAPPIGVQFAWGSFWVASTSGRHGKISRIDPTTYRITASIRAGHLPWFQGASVSDGALWVADALIGFVWRIDPTANRVIGGWRVGEAPIVTVADGLVWVNQANRTISRIDPGSNRIVEQLKVGGSLGGVASGYGAVWLVASSDGMLWRLDATV